MPLVRMLTALALSLALILPAGAQDEPVEDADIPTQIDQIPAGDEPTPEPTPAPPTPQPTPPPPTPVPTVGPTAVPGPGAVLLSDNFDDLSQARLPLTSGVPERSVGYIDGQYEIRNGDPEAASVVFTALPGRYTNSSIAVDARVTGGPTEPRRVVLGCRGAMPSGDGYRLRVFPDRQRFQIERFTRGQAATLLELPSTAIRVDSFNRVELSCVGNTISATVNGVVLGQAQDSTHSVGQHHIGVGGSGAVGRFDNLVVTQR